MKLGRDFFARESKIVAQDLVSRVLVRKLDGYLYEAEIIDTGAYEGCSKKRVKCLEYEPGRMSLFYTRGGYRTLVISTEKKGVPSVVTIRGALLRNPLSNEKYRMLLDGPGKLTDVLKISKELEGLFIDGNYLWIEGERVDDSLIEFIPPPHPGMSANCLGYYQLKL